MLPFRLGTTSYILPDDILPNVRFLADQVQDIELVLFAVDDGPNNLPSPGVVAELARLAAASGLSYTVHLPLNLKLGAPGGEADDSLAKARRVIERTSPLDPWAYVLHLDGEGLFPKERGNFSSPEAPEVQAWQSRSACALELVAGWVGPPDRLAVENIEHYPPEYLFPVFERIPVSWCVDIGHLWMEGRDPVAYLCRVLPRTRVVHIHGVAERDHTSLACVAPEALRPVVGCLMEAHYTGVLTIEVFGKDDFFSSKDALERSVRSLSGRPG